jgi:CDP-diacylglycerol---serine O-phosphatidyltransferase
MLKYLVPNGITSLSIVFSSLGIQSAVAGRPRTAAWWMLYCVLVDKLDGFAARGLRATSAIGLQLDSLADFLAFGIAPASLFYTFFSPQTDAGWATGPWLWGLRAILIF